jgi:hypothetical protein
MLAMVTAAVPIPYEQLADVCRKHGVARLELFGSVLRDDFEPGRSDVDVLVEYLPGQAVSFFDLGELEDDLSALFSGNRIDVVLRRKWIRKGVLEEARVIYVAER